MFGFGRKKEERSGMTATQSSPQLIEVLGLREFMAGGAVSVDQALGVPAVWTAVNLLAGTLAGLPLQVYRKKKDSRERVTTGLAPILHDAVNDEMTSFQWRKYTFERVFTTGRAFTFIERNASGRVMNLWPLDPDRVTVRRGEKGTVYVLNDNGKKKEYKASEVIDLPFMLKSDGVTHRGPIQSNKDAIARAIAATQYGARFLENGGIAPFAVTGPFQSKDALKRASDDMQAAVKQAASDGRQYVTLPMGLEIKQIASNPENTQLVETQRFAVEEVARIYSIPPVFLQDLTHGTFSNTEQQDLHFVKHTIKRWVEQAEQEMNLKLFGRGSSQYVEFNMDGLLRGDFKTRMEGYATAIQNGVMMPKEARDKENMADAEGSDRLFMQGATVPITETTKQPEGGDDGI